MNFLEKFNTDDVFFRGLIIGLLKNMNDKITYYQTGSDQIKREVFIPFFYSMAGDEPFLQDFYLSYADCDGNPAFAEGNYDVVPRGIVEFQNARVNTSASTNKFVRATYTKEVQNESGSEMKAFSAYMNPIPLDISINIKIKVDTTLDAFKVQQRTMQILFRNFTYYFEFEGFKVPVQVGLPDSPPDRQNAFSFTYGTTRGEGITLNFTISCETYLPQIDVQTERFRGNLMQGGIRAKVEFGIVPEDNSTILRGIGIIGFDQEITG